MMRVGSLFSGIGGMDLGFEVAGGYEIAWQVEKDAWCRRVLAKHWPDVPRYEDVTTLTGEELEPVDLICGGFPCQPVSHAGQQKGTDDDRWLWPHFARLLGVLRPRYALVENVPGLFTANDGRAFGEVVGDLAALGYDCEWHVISAADVGAPHLRKRVWIVAQSKRARPRVQSGHTEAGGQGRQCPGASESAVVSPDDGETRPEGIDTGCEDLADADRSGREERRRSKSMGAELRPAERGGQEMADAGCQPERREEIGLGGERFHGEEEGGWSSERDRPRNGGATLSDADSGGCVESGEPQQPPLEGARWRQLNGCSPDGRFFDAEIGGDWEPEPSVGRVAHGIPKRVDRLKGLGNAVVPQVVTALAQWITARAKGS